MTLYRGNAQMNEIIELGISIALSIILYILIRVQTKDVLKLGKRRKEYCRDP